MGITHTNMTICPTCRVRLVRVEKCCGRKQPSVIHKCKRCGRKYLVKSTGR